jgi:hypothetical protein
MNQVVKFLARELREALPATLLFLFLFHMVCLTKAVALAHYDLDALRATAATVAALIVAKAILVVEALPISRRWEGRGALGIAWKAFLFLLFALAFHFLEELVPLAWKHGIGKGWQAMLAETDWPLFGVLTLWLAGGLVLYAIAAELSRATGRGGLRSLLAARNSRGVPGPVRRRE